MFWLWVWERRNCVYESGAYRFVLLDVELIVGVARLRRRLFKDDDVRWKECVLELMGKRKQKVW